MSSSPVPPARARNIHSPAPSISVPVPSPEAAALAAREVEVLNLLSKGHPYKEIGQMLGISTHMVNVYVRRIYERLLHPASSSPASTSEITTLAARELEVLNHLAKGYLYKEIGEMMGISHHTVNTYVRRIYEKLQVRSRSQAVAKYRGLQ